MRKVLISLLIIFAMTGAANPDTLIKKTEAERESEFNKAISDVKWQISELDKINFRDGLKKSKNNFIRLYRTRWKTLGMSQKLDTAIDEAIKDKTDGLLWGTKGFQLGLNAGDIVNDIQGTIAFKFAETFDDFLKDLEENWSVALQNEIEDFYKRGSIVLLTADKNPMSRAYIRQNTTVEDNGVKITAEIRDKLDTKYPDLASTGLTAAGGLAIIFRKQLLTYAGKYLEQTVLYQKIATSTIGKALGKTLPVIGPVMLAWSLYDFASIAWSAESDVRKILHDRNQAMYSREMPEIYWDVMSPYVMDVLISSFGVLQDTKKQAEIFATDPRIIKLSEELNETEAMQFAERISLVVGALGRDKYDYILENFGELIKDSSPQNFKVLTRILHNENPAQVKEWLNVAGTRYYDLYALFPREVWEKFSPDNKSFESLNWLSRKLTPGARNTACKLSFNDINWIINELPEHYVPQLFAGSENDSDTIHREIIRLSEISDKEARKPYQGIWEYRWAKYNAYVFMALGLLFFAILLKGLLPVLILRSRDKNVVIYNTLPTPQPNNNYNGDRKFSVMLRISPELVEDVRRIVWDMSQTLTPAEDDNNARILSVKLDSLDEIKRWILRHRDNIEILQSEELKHELKQLPQGDINK